MVNRSGAAQVPDGVDVVAGDAADSGVHHRRSPRRRRGLPDPQPALRPLVEEFPALQAGVLAAAEAHGARLVSMENVYIYGRPAGRPLTETRRLCRHTKKGKLRGQMARICWRPTRPVGSRSRSDGPRTTSGHGAVPSPTSATGSSRPPSREAASVLGDPDQPHTYTYIPDIGEGLAVLGEHPDAAGEVWHLPNDPDTRTTRQLCRLVYRQAGKSRARLRQLPPLLLRVGALANPTLRELLEMQYQFAEPFIVDSTKIAYSSVARHTGRAGLGRHPRHLPCKASTGASPDPCSPT